MFQDTHGDVIPQCKKSIGCEIEELAADEELERKCLMFLRAIRLYEATGLAETQKQIFEQLGLLEDSELLLELMSIYLEHKQGKQKQKEAIQT